MPVGGLKVPDQLLGLKEPEVHAHPVTPPLLQMKGVLAEMHGQEKQATGPYGATPLDQGRGDLPAGQVDNRVEGNDSGPGVVGSRKPTEVSLLEVNGRVEPLGAGDQDQREI